VASAPSKDGDAAMRIYHVLIFLPVILLAFTNCGEDSKEPIDVSEDSEDINVYGKVTDKETGDPIEGASVSIGGEAALTDADGKYVLEGIPFSDAVDVVVTAANYRDYRDSLPSDQRILDINLVPVDSPSARVLEVLEALSRDIEALDTGRIPDIQSRLSEDYTAADNEVTLVGVWAGVVPPDHDGLRETVFNIIEKYDKLVFQFADPNVEFSGDEALVNMRFEVYAETKPPEPKKWYIVVDGRLDLRKENDDWKITYWKLVSDFQKFEWEPL
jgi:hypothetical protein